jgi:hypothetical protein
LNGNKTFNVKPGVPNKDKSTVYVSPNILYAGEEAKA